MNTEKLMEQMRDCAFFLYQNSEQEAYGKLNEILPQMNQMLQSVMQTSIELERIVVMVLNQFLDAYQQRDNLALADLLNYEIPAVLAAVN